MMFPATIPQSTAGFWATKIPYRTPEWRVHATKGNATLALSQRGMHEPFALYNLQGDTWHKVLEYVPSDTCRCDQKYMDVYARNHPGQGSYSRGKFMLSGAKLHKGDLPLCLECYETESRD